MLFQTSCQSLDLLQAKNVFDSTGIQNLDKLPEKLGVLGGGNIGLEFAGLYNKLGSKVTVLDALDTFLPRAEPSIAALAKQYMEEDGIELLQNIRTTEIKNDGDQVLLVTENKTYRFDALLYSTGRKPNVEPLQLENTDIELTERGAIKVDKHCQTNVPGVFAVGDVNGGLNLLTFHLMTSVLFTATLLEMAATHLKTVSMYQTLCSSHLHFHKLV